MNYTEKDIFEALDLRHSRKVREKLWNARVGIGGIGGLGSHTALALARAGVGHLHIVDDDEVELSNINRQAYFLNQVGRKKTDALAELIGCINPYIDVRADCCRVTEENITELFRDDKIICEAFDLAENKAAFVNGVLTGLPEAAVVSGSGMAGWGDVNEIRTRRVTKRLYICGDETNGLESGLPLTSGRVMACAAHQANTVLRLILDME